MSVIQEKLVTIKGNKATLSQVGGVLSSSYRSLNLQQLLSLLTIPPTKHDLQHRLKRKVGRRSTRKFRKRRRGGKKSRRR
jgi:hypothetical protein